MKEDLNLTVLLPDDGWGSDDKLNSRHLVSYIIFSGQVLLLYRSE